MRNSLLKHLLEGAFNSTRSRSGSLSAGSIPAISFSYTARRHAVSSSLAEEESDNIVFPREGPGVSYGLNWALAGRGVYVKDKAFHNLKSSELQQNGASTTEGLSGLPVHIRGNGVKEASEISKSQFNKLLKHVTSHISSVSNVFVQDGAVGSSPRSDAKVRVISDHPSAVLQISNILWRTPTRAVSHDSCPLTVYVASTISSNTGDIIGLGPQANSGFLVADTNLSTLILCGKAFADAGSIKEALAAIAAPVISARGGLPISARLLVSGDSVVLVLAPEDTIKNCSELHEFMASTDAGVVLSPHGVASLFRTKDSSMPNLFKLPTALIIASIDSSGSLPSVSKLSPGQAAYHFLAGFQDGKFVPTYNKNSSVDPVELAKGLLKQLSDNEIPSFLVNVSKEGKHVTGKELLKLIESTLSKSSLPPGKSTNSKAGDLGAKYKEFFSAKFQDLPEEFSF